jgi:hypothetical protein
MKFISEKNIREMCVSLKRFKASTVGLCLCTSEHLCDVNISDSSKTVKYFGEIYQFSVWVENFVFLL